MKIATQTVPTSYKQTEIGVIPEDWDVQELGEVAQFERGQGLSKSDLQETGKYKCIHYGQLFSDYIELIKEVKSKTNYNGVHFLSKSNDVLVPTSDVTPRGLATASCIKENGVLLGGGILIIRLNNGYDGTFFSYWITQNKREVLKLVKGSTVFHIYGHDMSGLRLAFPKDKEQIAIATVLSDTDSLIEKLEKLIAKKKAVKQGAMQRLLIGKKRLPGFSGEWEEKKLGKVCENVTTGKLDANAMKKDGEYRFYTCAKEYYFIDKYAFDTEALLVSGNGANVGYIHYYKGKFNAYQRTYVLSTFHEDIFFTKLLLDKNLKERIRTEVNSGNTPYITMGTLTEMSILFPPRKEEQTAIATFLSDMDTEIESLKKSLSKYQQIKTGMMQQLLTGKIRLVKNNL